MHNRSLSLICLFCCVLIACSEQVKKDSSDDNFSSSSLDFVDTSSNDAGNTSQSPSNNNSQFPQLEGIWNSPCKTGIVEYVQDHIQLNAGNFHQESQFHPDSACSTKTKPPVVVSGTYEIGSDVITSNGLIAKEIDVILDSDGGELRIQDIAYIDETGTLYFGVEMTTNTRPTVLDFINPYTQ